jgi:uncharacterized membrane protein HdeD (DUF308 family)
MAPQFPQRDPIRRFSLVPLLSGLALVVVGILMIFHPDVFIRVLLVLAGIPVLMAGIGLMLFGFDLWRKVPKWRGQDPAEYWRSWRGGK